jgi:glycosyltransferase involved in cell wall biosynthesis
VPERKIGLVAPLPPQVGGVASFAEWLLAHEEELGCRFDTFDLWRPADGGVGGRFTPAALFTQARLAPRFVRWARRAPRVVHYCASTQATGLARDVAFAAILRVAGRRTIAHLHGDLTRPSPAARVGLRLLSRLSAETVVASPKSLAMLGISAQAVANPTRFEPGGGGARPASASLRLLFVGAYGVAKGTLDLLEASSEARAAGADVTLTIAGKEGQPGDRERLEQVLRDRELENGVEFLGVVPAAGLPAVYGAADVICLPSRAEGMPMALLEGMSFGLPALATRVGEIPQLVGEDAGVLVEPGDVAGLTAAIVRLAADPQARAAMGAAAAERARSVSNAETIVREWRAAYEELAPA